MDEEKKIPEEILELAAAHDRIQKEWEALSDEEKERRANSPEVLEARFWEDLSDWDPVIISKSQSDKSKSDH